MNILQGFDALQTFCITLNPQQPIEPALILRQFSYHHPVFNQITVLAQTAAFADKRAAQYLVLRRLLV